MVLCATGFTPRYAGLLKVLPFYLKIPGGVWCEAGFQVDHGMKGRENSPGWLGSWDITSDRWKVLGQWIVESLPTWSLDGPTVCCAR
jgi:hypothetical protein